MTNNEEYCGLLCSEIIEKQQEIIDELVTFSKYNPEYSKVMFEKLIVMLTGTNDGIKK